MSQIRVDEREQAEMSRWHADSEMINTSRCVFIAACFRQHSLTCDGHNVILNSRTTHTHTHPRELNSEKIETEFHIFIILFIWKSKFVLRAHALTHWHTEPHTLERANFHFKLLHWHHRIGQLKMTIARDRDRNSEGARHQKEYSERKKIDDLFIYSLGVVRGVLWFC